MQQVIERGAARRRIPCRQTTQILDHIRLHGGDWSIGELAHALALEKSAVSARVHTLLHETRQLVATKKRRDRISGITVRPVALPAHGGNHDHA